MTDIKFTILSFAENRDSLLFSDLYSYINSLSPISKTTLSWHLRKLVKDNILFKLGRGIYTLKSGRLPEYEPVVRCRALKVAKLLSASFPFITISIFDGSTLSDFQHHISINNLHYIEVDREATESVFHFLKQHGYLAYLNPDRDFTYNTIDISKEAFIVKPLITESPLTDTESTGIKTPRPEKILVDILCNDDMDYLHGNEWEKIFSNVLKRFAINRSTMLRYASRRNAKAAIEKALSDFDNNYD